MGACPFLLLRHHFTFLLQRIVPWSGRERGGGGQVELVFVKDFVTGEWSSLAPAGPGGVSPLPNIKQLPPFVPAQKSALLHSLVKHFSAVIGKWPGTGPAHRNKSAFSQIPSKEQGLECWMFGKHSSFSRFLIQSATWFRRTLTGSWSPDDRYQTQ